MASKRTRLDNKAGTLGHFTVKACSHICVDCVASCNTEPPHWLVASVAIATARLKTAKIKITKCKILYSERHVMSQQPRSSTMATGDSSFSEDHRAETLP
ncbi:hypothetical protein ISCGN_029091 [Ixodes scapularis]